jgi:cardiolipin synthase C
VPIGALIPRQPDADDLRILRRDLGTQRGCLKKSTYWLKVQESDLLKQIDADKVPLVWGQAEVLSDHTLKCIDPDDSRQTIKMTQKLKDILEAAQSELLMVTPYFVPGQAGVRLFREMRGRNLTIKIITNSFLSTDAPLAQIGYMRYRQDLLRLGVELYEIKPSVAQLKHDQDRRQFGGDFRRLCSSFIQGGASVIQRGASRIQIGGSSLQYGGSSRGSLHAKTFVLDRQTVFVGSFNFDPRSMRLDTQNGIVIRSSELADQAICLFDKGISPTLTYRVILLGGDDLVWVSEEDGKEVRYYQEPLSRFWPRLSLKGLSWLTPELML